MKTYPICLVGLDNELAVIVGGGNVAARKAEALLEAGARVRVISPNFSPEFKLLQEDNPLLTCLSRPYQPGDLADAWVVIAATDNPEINHQVAEEARRGRKLINVVDDPEHSNFIAPAVIRRSQVTLSISTGGGSPALARRLREKLEAVVGPEYGALADLLAEARPLLIETYPPGEARLQAALRAIDSNLLEVIRLQGIDAARRRLRGLIIGEEAQS